VRERSDVLAALEALEKRGERGALATIVSTRGSTYRRAGARLLVPEKGPWVGNLSGGCLEGEVVGVAREVMDDRGPRLATFDLSAEDEAVWGWGLGCNGSMEVFVEPADRPAALARQLRRALEGDGPLVAALVVESSLSRPVPGDRAIVDVDGEVEGSLGHRAVEEAVRERAAHVLREGRTATDTLPLMSGSIRALFEVLEPPVRLLVCGAGHDAIPLVRYAADLGWKSLVVDDREALLNEDRFPGAAGFVHVERPEEAAAAAGVDERTAVMIMTHHYLRDRAYLGSVLGSAAFYIGALGPRARLERLLAELSATEAKEGLRVLHGPAGLDIGAEGPEEIAWAIVAEVLAVRRRRSAGFLRDSSGPIHDRPGQAIYAGEG
jgi:xanthine dehydrogenase accessory factor